MAGESTDLERRVAVLERRLGELEDIEAVRSLLARYSKTLDVRDAAGFAPLWAREARVAVPQWGVDVRGYEAVMAFYLEYFRSPWKDPRHHCANEIIEHEGAGMRAFSYFHETAVHEGESIIGWGSWDDRFVREDGSWKFAERVVTILALTPVDKGWAHAQRIIGA